jgi:hypothetical protein
MPGRRALTLQTIHNGASLSRDSIPASCLGYRDQETGYADWEISWNSSVSAGRCWDSIPDYTTTFSFRSWHSSVFKATICELNGRGSVPSRRNIVLFFATSRPLLGPPIQWVQQTRSPGIKGQRHVTDRSLPSSARVKNSGAKPPVPIRRHGVVLN